MPKGALVGIGRTAEVFDWEDGWVLKLYRAPIPRAWVEHEAELVTSPSRGLCNRTA